MKIFIETFFCCKDLLAMRYKLKSVPDKFICTLYNVNEYIQSTQCLTTVQISHNSEKPLIDKGHFLFGLLHY